MKVIVNNSHSSKQLRAINTSLVPFVFQNRFVKERLLDYSVLPRNDFEAFYLMKDEGRCLDSWILQPGEKSHIT